jgi:inward rectifier potassium channel
MQKSSPPAERLPPLGTGSIPAVVARGRKRAPWDDIFHGAITCSWPLFLAAVLGAYLCINALFACVYLTAPGCVTNVTGFEDAFYFSVECLTTIGFGGMTPATRFGHIVVSFEALVGIFSIAIITGVTFARFSRPQARVLFSDKAVIGMRDGVPTLAIRLANYRHNTIGEATIRVFLLVTKRTKEGEMLRVPIDLKLARERTATFILTWMVLHVIDEHSPFYGGEAKLEQLRAEGADLYAALHGIDDTLGQVVLSRHRYTLDNVAYNAQFEDVLSFAADGTRIVDYAKFHDVKPQRVESNEG